MQSSSWYCHLLPFPSESVSLKLFCAEDASRQSIVIPTLKLPFFQSPKLCKKTPPRSLRQQRAFHLPITLTKQRSSTKHATLNNRKAPLQTARQPPQRKKAQKRTQISLRCRRGKRHHLHTHTQVPTKGTTRHRCTAAGTISIENEASQVFTKVVTAD